MDVTLTELIISAAIFCAAMTMTPGPNNVLLAQSGALYGVRRTIRHIVGIRLGTTALHIGMLCGLGALFEQIPGFHQLLKYVAVTYLIWLAYSISTAPVVDAAAGKARQPLGLIEAAVFQWINPKSWLAVMTLCSAYTVSGDSYWQSAVLMVLVFNLVGFPASFTWVLLGQAVGRILNTNLRKRAFNVSMALLLLLTLPMIIV